MNTAKRLALGILVAVVLLAAAGIIHLVTRDPLAGAIAHYRGSHEPITPEDFETPAPSDEQNAAVAIRDAMQQLSLSEEDGRWLGDVDYFKPSSAEDEARARRIIAEQSTAIATAHSATTRPAILWPGPVIVPATAADFTRLNNVRSLARLLCLAAVTEHRQGNDVVALQRIEDAFTLGRVAGHDGPLIAHLIQVGVGAAASESARVIAGDLAVNPSTRPQIAALIAELLDDDARTAEIVRSWQCERATALETVRVQIANSLGARLALGSGVSTIASASDRARAANILSNWPAAKASLAKSRPPAPSPLSISQNMAAILAPATERAIETSFRLVTDYRMTAVVLAIHLYQTDHAGQLPAKLDDLVPAYLARIPADALAAGDQPLHYHATDKPILYSVGQNGLDDGGDATPADAKNGGPWSAPDYVIPLSK